MIWAGMALVAGLLSDWPWLWLAFGLAWWAHFGQWNRAPGLFWGELLGVLVLEALLTFLRRNARPMVSGNRLFGQGAMLMVFSVCLGAILGFVGWQFTIGAGAASRVHEWAIGTATRIGLRGIRLAAGIGVLWLLARSLGG